MTDSKNAVELFRKEIRIQEPFKSRIHKAELVLTRSSCVCLFFVEWQRMQMMMVAEMTPALISAGKCSQAGTT